jgi:hypothetical protein
VKQFGEELLDKMVEQSHLIHGLLTTLKELYPLIKVGHKEMHRLLYNIIWTLGILSAEKPAYANLFIH